MRRRGYSIIELVVCLALLGLVIGFVVELLPSSALSLQRAADLTAASAYGVEMLDNARVNAHGQTGIDVDQDVSVGKTRFHVSRAWFAVPSETMSDVVVTIQGPRGSPLVVGTRVAYHGP